MATQLLYPEKIVRDSFDKETIVRTLEAKFGDGYAQHVEDGLNSSIDEYAITWGNLSLVEKQALEVFLTTHGGWGRLLWTPPYESVEKIFVVKEGKRKLRIINNNVFHISCTLQQVYM